jgi:hypothetical protein
MDRVSSELRQESLNKLRELLPPGSTVYTVLRHKSRGGTTRWIDLFVIANSHRTPDDQPRLVYLSGYAWNIGVGEGKHPADQRDGRGGLRVSGGGMDMGYALVHHLRSLLSPDDRAAGYDLRQEWI